MIPKRVNILIFILLIHNLASSSADVLSVLIAKHAEDNTDQIIRTRTLTLDIQRHCNKYTQVCFYVTVMSLIDSPVFNVTI